MFIGQLGSKDYKRWKETHGRSFRSFSQERLFGVWFDMLRTVSAQMKFTVILGK